MKNIKSIPANETQFTPKSGRNSITYRFVSGGRELLSRCTVQLGDTDPFTGEAITDVNLFREYYRVVDREIHQTLKTVRPECTREEKARRENEKRRFIDEFTAEHGYAPSRDDVMYHLSRKGMCGYVFSLDQIVNDEDRDKTDKCPDLLRCAVNPFEDDDSDEVTALKELAETFTGRRKAVYEAMLDKLAGGAGRLSNAELARRWGVSEGQIRKDQTMIIRMIREKIGR